MTPRIEPLVIFEQSKVDHARIHALVRLVNNDRKGRFF